MKHTFADPRLTGLALTGQKEYALRAILAAYPGWVSGDALVERIGSDSQTRKVVVSRLRKAVAPYGLRIDGMQCVGYRAEWRDGARAGALAYEFNLSRTRAQILEMLLEKPGDIVPRERLLAAIYGGRTDIKAPPYMLLVDHIRHMRASLAGRVNIITRWNAGYSAVRL